MSPLHLQKHKRCVKTEKHGHVTMVVKLYLHFPHDSFESTTFKQCKRRGTSRAKRYKPNQQDRCTYSSRVQNSSRSHRTSSRDQPGQAIPPTAVASRQSWRSRYTLSIGSTTTIHINHVHSLSCHVLSALILRPHQRRMRVRAQVPQDQAGIFVNPYFIFFNSYLYL